MSVLALPAAACGCSNEDVSEGLLSIDEALSLIDDAVYQAVDSELLATAKANGRCLAQPIVAQDQHPLFDNSAMDGFAVRTVDLRGCGPWKLPVTDQVFAGGHALIPVSSNAVQVFTGAPIPGGCDAVIAQEDVVKQGDFIGVAVRPRFGQHIRRAGEDIRRSEIIAKSGTLLNPRTIAAAATVGAATVNVWRKIRVAIMITGCEVTAQACHLDKGSIHDTNGPMLTALLDRSGVEVSAIEWLGDNLKEQADKILALAGNADLLVTTGGVSVGKADHVKSAFTQMGGHITFSGVAIKPGKPISFGKIGDTHWLGLPGNPVSAFVTWSLFGEAILDKVMGRTKTNSNRRLVVTDQDLHHRPGRCEFRFANLKGLDGLGREIVDCCDAMHSARMAPMLNSDGLVSIPADIETLPKGSIVEYTPHRNICARQ